MSNVGTATLGIAGMDGRSNDGMIGTDGKEVGAGSDGSSTVGSAVISIVGNSVRGIADRSNDGMAIDGTAKEAPTDGGGVGNFVNVYVGNGEARSRVNVGNVDGNTKPNCRPRRFCAAAKAGKKTVSLILIYY